ncbi:hypothetical protein [Limnohabitans sp. MMS-10A-178]|jgi:hypothetical protein|uniref:hypothetical protein n=1 Tax=Limnohabitans sp. MMS-10A-178 TaxID=1835767 RepID=UPI000D3D358D|nr:hypothetical protein [Limnohabitans sp. MMS-10A-178]PUE14730.1 hypothetical protein B9Z32_09615 [Limnohabitans sp. MMS-10A-178]
MTFALFGISSIYNGIQKFMSAAAHLEQHPAQAIHLGANSAQESRLSKQLALRVLRVAEHGEAPNCAGRMVISGRMADVCAELDRLVALEAQNKAPLHH